MISIAIWIEPTKIACSHGVTDSKYDLLTSAPRAINVAAASIRLRSVAVNSGVSPNGFWRFKSAPASTSILMTDDLSQALALCKGVPSHAVPCSFSSSGEACAILALSSSSVSDSIATIRDFCTSGVSA